MTYDWPVYYSWGFLAACVLLSAVVLALAPSALTYPRASTRSGLAVATLVVTTALVCVGSLAAFPTASWGLAMWFGALSFGFRSSARLIRLFVALAVSSAVLMSPFFIGALKESISEWLSMSMGLSVLGMVVFAPFSATLSGMALWFSQSPIRRP